ncbi:MAG: DUF2312 domain-containing protein [Filomicrobium sp.]|nr:DUF2312 domain-containing protein [Filomicrobium sp.]
MTVLQASTQAQLRQYIEQIERLEEEKKAIGGDIKDKFMEAKCQGFDVKAMRKVIALRKKSKVERDEEDAILNVYLHAMGMAGTPLDDWANEQETPTANDTESTISLNGGPAVPMSVVKEALTVVKAEKRAKGRLRGQRVELPEGAEG